MALFISSEYMKWIINGTQFNGRAILKHNMWNYQRLADMKSSNLSHIWIIWVTSIQSGSLMVNRKLRIEFSYHQKALNNRLSLQRHDLFTIFDANELNALSWGYEHDASG